MRYAIVIERVGNNYSVYVPDLPGCVATGGTPADAAREIRTAIEFHLKSLHEDGMVVAEPVSEVGYVDVPRHRDE